MGNRISSTYFAAIFAGDCAEQGFLARDGVIRTNQRSVSRMYHLHLWGLDQ